MAKDINGSGGSGGGCSSNGNSKNTSGTSVGGGGGGGSGFTGKRMSSRNSKPYDAKNKSFIKKVATKVTDLIPQRSWISKWFNTSQDNGDMSDDIEYHEVAELEEEIEKPPPSKRPRIRMDITHPPGTFFIQPRKKVCADKDDSSKEQYSIRDDLTDFLEPTMAGPSGIGHLISSTPAQVQMDGKGLGVQRSELNSLIPMANSRTINGTDDNSESSESTSGCSSLIPQINRQEVSSNLAFNSPFANRKRFSDDKLTLTNHLQSPRSLFLDSSSRDTLSSRRPSFNASVMTNTLDRASPLSSPFYSGNTTFGGANTVGLYKRRRSLLNDTSEFQLKVPKRTNIQVKPSNTANIDSSGMSQTARKILEALEHFSSPISDAKKIPLKGTNSSISSRANNKRVREEASTPSARIGLRHLTQELTVPTVPEMLKLRQRQKLQDSTVAVKKIVSAHSDPPPLPAEYRFRIGKNKITKHHGKVKAKSKVNIDEEETIETVNLPSIPLPISSLPSFNFALPHHTNMEEENTSQEADIFKFASPIKVTNATKNLKSINNFTFSDPITPENKVQNESSNSGKLEKTLNVESNASLNRTSTSSIPNFIWSDSKTGPRLKENTKNKDTNETGITVADELKSGSIMDILSDKSFTAIHESSKLDSTTEQGKQQSSDAKFSDVFNKDAKDSEKDTIQSTMDIWECNDCLIKNKISDSKCFACKAVKPNCKNNIIFAPLPKSSSVEKVKDITTDTFVSQFKLPDKEWECTSCSIKNKMTAIKCVSCNALKTGNLFKTESTVANTSVSMTTMVTTMTMATTTMTMTASPLSSYNLMDKFKPAEGSWECPGCMLRNESTIITCPCCNASKPSTLKVSPKKNKNIPVDEDISSKPKISTDTTANTSVTTLTAPPKSDIMEKFKPCKDSWECPSCMVRNTNTEICPCCSTVKPNSTSNKPTEVQSLPANGFGDKFKKPEGSWCCNSCMLSNKAELSECIACGTSKAGVEKTIVKTESTASMSSSGLQFSFSVPSNTIGGFKFGVDKVDNQQKSDNTSTNGFKFGDTQKNSDIAKFTFSIPKEDKKDISEATKAATVIPICPQTSTDNTKFQFTGNCDKTDKNTNLIEGQTKKMPLFSFGVQKTKDASLSTEKQIKAPTLPAFTFNAQKIESNKSENKEPLKTTFGTVTKVPKSNTVVPVSNSNTYSNTTLPLLTTQSSILESKPAPIFSFVPPSTTVSANTTVSTSVTSCLPSYSQHSFTFTDSKTTTQSVVTPTFGQMVTSTASIPTLSTTFTFGANKTTDLINPLSKKPAVSLNNAIPVLSVLSNTSNTGSLFNSTEEKTPAFQPTTETNLTTFNAGGSKPLVFGTTENKVPVFGNSENKPTFFGTSDSKISVFRNAEKPTPMFNAPVATLAFGSQPSNLSPFVPSAPIFENNSTFNPPSTSQIFSMKPNEINTPNSNLFTFGAASNQTASSQPASGFNFSGNTNPVASTQNPLFTFGSNSNTAPTNNLFGGATFSNPPAPTNNATNFTFNSPGTPAFSQPSVGVPLFGVPQPNQSQSTSSFSAAPSSNTGYNFGAAASTTASTGFTLPSTSSEGFPFNPPSSIPPTFNENFNFTGSSDRTTSIHQFNAPPQAVRKMKKAVRRVLH